MHGSTGGGWKRNAPASPRQFPTQPSSVATAEQLVMEHNVTAPEPTGLRLLMGQPPSVLRMGGSPDRADAAEVSASTAEAARGATTIMFWLERCNVPG
jgi:hypothetical protein